MVVILAALAWFAAHTIWNYIDDSLLQFVAQSARGQTLVKCCFVAFIVATVTATVQPAMWFFTFTVAFAVEIWFERAEGNLY